MLKKLYRAGEYEDPRSFEEILEREVDSHSQGYIEGLESNVRNLTRVVVKMASVLNGDQKAALMDSLGFEEVIVEEKEKELLEGDEDLFTLKDRKEPPPFHIPQKKTTKKEKYRK